MPSTGSVSDATQGLADISEQIRKLSEDLAAKKAASQATDVTEYQKQTQDVSNNDKPWHARDIGILIPGNSRLNLFTNLAEKDKADAFAFRVYRQGEVQLARIGDGDVRIQLFTKQGRLVADSDGETESLTTAFKDLEDGKLELNQGGYILRIERPSGTKDKDVINYGIQLTMGSFKNDYDTIEYAMSKGQKEVDPFEISTATSKVIESLNNSVSFIVNLPPIGQTGTEKLLGMMADFQL